MEIRPASAADLNQLTDIDGTIESIEYLFVERTGAGLSTSWKLSLRPLRQKLIAPHRLSEETYFSIRQIASGADEGIVLVAEHEQMLVALLAAQPRPERNVMELLDLRVDYDFRRQGLGTALLFQLLQSAREAEFRAVSAMAATNNIPAIQLLSKCGFDLAGLDTQRESNHDLVKESVSLLWYATLD